MDQMERRIDVQADPESLGDLFSRLTTDLSKLMHDEVELAKVELKESAREAGTAGASLGAAGVFGLLALLLLSFAAAWGLAEVLPEGVGFLIVGGAYGVVALALLAFGRQRLKTIKPVPEQTVETLKEDVAWAKQQMS